VDRITGPDTPVHPLLDGADLLPAMQLTCALTDSALRSELSRLKGEAVDTAPMAQVLPVYSRLAGLALPGLEGFSTAEASDAVASRPLSAGVISPADWPAARELVSRVARVLPVLDELQPVTERAASVVGGETGGALASQVVYAEMIGGDAWVAVRPTSAAGVNRTAGVSLESGELQREVALNSRYDLRAVEPIEPLQRGAVELHRRTTDIARSALEEATLGAVLARDAPLVAHREATLVHQGER